MRKIVAVLAVPLMIGAVVVGAARAWRRHPRVGTAFVNSVVNPVLLRRGLAGSGRSEIAALEHFGRKSGTKRLTPVHPEVIQNGFRIIVPLGTQSEWARNVIAAGHCRIHLHDQVFDLDEPALVDAGDLKDLPWPVRRVTSALGFKYLILRTLAPYPGTAANVAGESIGAGQPGRIQESVVGRDVAWLVRGRRMRLGRQVVSVSRTRAV